MKYYLNLGSNIGNRLLHISRALKAIGEEFGPYEISHKVESDPWGFDSTNRFVNIGVAIESELAPESVLQKLKFIEKSISSRSHRRCDGSYNDREIDIDIMATNGEEYHSECLHIPHPHLKERDFFMTPLKELAPDIWKKYC